MPAFVIVDIGHKDDADLARFVEYERQVGPLLAQAGGLLRALDPAPRIVEGGWRPRTVVINEFPDVASAQAFYASDAYVPLRALRQELTDAHIIIVEGIAG
jgi:uncharacterized protein (DUF1330 family)